MEDGVRILGIEDVASAAPAVSLAQLTDAARNDPQLRFTMELEFVESLANAEYLQYLADQRLLDAPAFVAYLAYLQYWRTPAYIRYIQYPHALLFLELLQAPAFRRRCADAGFVRYLQDSQFWHSKWYRHNRTLERQDADRLQVAWLLAEADAHLADAV